MTDREIARYRQVRSGLHVTASEALALARHYCSFTDEQHAQFSADLDARLAEHTARTLAEGPRGTPVAIASVRVQRLRKGSAR